MLKKTKKPLWLEQWVSGIVVGDEQVGNQGPSCVGTYSSLYDLFLLSEKKHQRMFLKMGVIEFDLGCVCNRP